MAVYDDVVGLVGLKTPEGNNWRFYTPGGIFFRTGGWYWNGKQTTSSENSLFHSVSLYYKQKTNGDILTGKEYEHDYSQGTFLCYFGPPPPDGQDYPSGALHYDDILHHMNGTVPILHLVGSKDPFWRVITLRSEDVDAEPPAPEPAPVRRAPEIPPGYGPSSALARVLPRRRGGARKTKARRAVKKRRTARRR